MSDIVLQKNLGALIDTKSVLALSPYTWTAAGASDASTITSNSIDREGAFNTGSLPRSLDVEIFFAATLGSGKTLSLTLELDSSPDNSTWTALTAESATVAATGPSGGGAVNNQLFRMTVQTTADNPTPGPGINIGGAQRYLRLLVMPDLSATATDTATIQAIGLTFGGFDQLAAPTN